MPVQILDAVIHGIKKASETNTADAKLREQCFSNDEPILNSFTEQLLTAFSTEANTWGDISPPEHNIFHQNLFKWQLPEEGIEPISFIDFSKETITCIIREIIGSYQATGGYVLFIRYQVRNEVFLLVVMLKLETAYGIKEEDMSIFETQSFSMKNFHEAARLNLSTWNARQGTPELDEDDRPERCFSFIKKRGASEDITKYLRNALGCTNYAESTANTVNLIKAVDAFFESKQATPEIKQQKKSQLHDYLAMKIQERAPASLKDITGLLSSTDEDDEENELLKFIKDNDYKIDETFKPNSAKVRGLARVSGKIGDATVNFPVSDLDQNVFYDTERRQLTILNIPDDLDKRIKKAKGG